MARPDRLALSSMPRVSRQLYEQCACEGCGRTPRAYSRFCSLHARKYFRCRSPTGRALRAAELKSYRELAAIYVDRHRNHKAVSAALQFIGSTLTDTTLPGSLRKQMDRLRRDGATAGAMLVEFLSVIGLEESLPHTVDSDSCRAFNVGNRCLRACPPPTLVDAFGKRRPTHIPARVAELYGTHLRAALGLFGVQLWRHIHTELEAPQRAARDVAEAVRSFPFGSQEAAPTQTNDP